MFQSSEIASILITFVLLFFVVIAIASLFRKLFIGVKRVYKPKGPYLLSPGEKKFFEALSKVISPNSYICPKVRLADLISVDLPNTDRSFWTYFGKISQKHVDFVICSSSNFSPELIVELDGGSHKEKSQTLRDELVDKVFKDADIPIIHIKPKGYYDYGELRKEIENSIKQDS